MQNLSSHGSGGVWSKYARPVRRPASEAGSNWCILEKEPETTWRGVEGGVGLHGEMGGKGGGGRGPKGRNHLGGAEGRAWQEVGEWGGGRMRREGWTRHQAR